ncbi:DUF4097 family beta strand repeat-containing protein [Actinoplanes sp. CA-142083]|uniref:DUF4097 family beta strand repeat-containing protein n=1 Tax=Actinoplanes sp. CA-142083 TaxID=3239903 RepID=UPI003D8B2D9B
MQKFDTTAPIAAVLDIPAARIRLVAADRPDTTVEVRPADATKERDVKAADQIRVDYADGVLRVEAAPPSNRLFGNSGAADVTVHLPTGSRVNAKVAAAQFHGTGNFGEVTVDAAQADITLDETASAHLTVQSGSVVVARLLGPAEISTQKGDIKVAEATQGAVTLTTQSGDITIDAASGASASLDAGTPYGRIHNALRNTDGEPALTIRATTNYGNVTARSL